MKLTINTDILKRHNLSLGEFLLMLLSYFEIDIKQCEDRILTNDIAGRNLFNVMGIILSNNSRDLVARILMESDDKAIHSGIDFESLAKKLQECYPAGNKPGKTYPWRGDAEEIAQKLRILVVKHDFTFTEEEAINATKEYVASYAKHPEKMALLKYFLLRTSKSELSSPFMTLIENNRPSTS